MPKAAIRLKQPTSKPIEPANSAAMARKASGVGNVHLLGEEVHGAGEAVAAEPTEHLLRSMREHHGSQV